MICVTLRLVILYLLLDEFDKKLATMKANKMEFRKEYYVKFTILK